MDGWTEEEICGDRDKLERFIEELGFKALSIDIVFDESGKFGKG